MDNEEDCGCVIRVGNPGRHCNNDNVRDDLQVSFLNDLMDHLELFILDLMSNLVKWNGFTHLALLRTMPE